MAAQSFLTELRRRNVIRMAGLYLVGAWLLVQVASTLFPAFGVPAWALRALVIVFALGFLPALLFAWVYELTPEGIKRDAEVPPDQAFECLERCFPIHDAGLVRLPFDPAMDPLRSDPRFAALVRKMGFPK